MWYIRRLQHGECEFIWPCSYSNTNTEWSQKKSVTIKVSQQFFTYFWLFSSPWSHTFSDNKHNFSHWCLEGRFFFFPNSASQSIPISMGILASHVSLPCSIKRAGTRLDWVSLLRGETPALLRQWLLMPPASSLRSRRIHHRTDGCMINIHGMKSQDGDLDQWSFTFYPLLDSY